MTAEIHFKLMLINGMQTKRLISNVIIVRKGHVTSWWIIIASKTLVVAFELQLIYTYSSLMCIMDFNGVMDNRVLNCIT